ncbi:hypothetical protein DRJ17_07630 [Candidatus Woesearchaeota archaeon]|nr:MAG: hypothetical protein DRJ17_07630 [Candidatus Woesearchaeota archaeon]
MRTKTRKWEFTEFGKWVIVTIAKIGEELLNTYGIDSLKTTRTIEEEKISLEHEDPDFFIKVRVGLGFLLGIFWRDPRLVRYSTLLAIKFATNSDGVIREELEEFIIERLEIPVSKIYITRAIERLRTCSQDEYEKNVEYILRWADMNYKELDKVKYGLILVHLKPDTKKGIAYKLTELGERTLELIINIYRERKKREPMPTLEIPIKTNTTKLEDLDEMAWEIVEYIENLELTKLYEISAKIRTLNPLQISELLIKIYNKIKEKLEE